MVLPRGFGSCSGPSGLRPPGRAPGHVLGELWEPGAGFGLGFVLLLPGLAAAGVVLWIYGTAPVTNGGMGWDGMEEGRVEE